MDKLEEVKTILEYFNIHSEGCPEYTLTDIAKAICSLFEPKPDESRLLSDVEIEKTIGIDLPKHSQGYMYALAFEVSLLQLKDLVRTQLFHCEPLIRADERDKAAYGKEQIKLADKHYHDLKIEFDDRIEKARADERTKVAYMIADKCDCRKKPETVLDEILDWTEGIIKKEVVALKKGEMPQ